RRAIHLPCPSSPVPAGPSAASVPGARPPFFDPCETGSNRGETVVECEPRGVQGWASIIREGTTHGRTGAPRDFGDRITPSFEVPFNGAYPADTLLQFLL